MSNDVNTKVLSREEISDYVTYSGKFEGYKWIKPIWEVIITGLFWILGTAVCIIIALIIVVVSGGEFTEYFEQLRLGYDGFDSYTLHGAIASLGSIALLIPAARLATKILKSRPFHSALSSCGGFDFKIFGKVLLLALIVVGIPQIIYIFLNVGSQSAVKFTVAGFIACIILGPLQCMGEEVMFRGLILQGIGSWVKKPVIAIIIQTLLFALLHSYGILGIIEVCISGALMGITAYYTKGLEASGAYHIVNNMIIFLVNGFGFSTITSNGTSIGDVLFVVITQGVYVAIMILADRKFNWFNRIPKETDIVK